MRRTILIFIGIITLLFQYACTEIIDPDITGETVTLLAPSDSLITCNSNQSFWWEVTAFAEAYNIQIVKPDFQNTETLVLDSILTDNKLEISLAPGSYQWRVAALNTNTWTDYTVRTLIVDSLFDFSTTSLSLLTPVDGAITNQNSQLFIWEEDERMNQYSFLLYYKGVQVHTQTLNTNTYQENIIWGDGEYKWTVKGISCSSATQINWSLFVLDTKNPEKPLLISPSNLSETTDSIVLFKWERDALDLSSELEDSLFVYTDSLLKNMIIRKRLSETGYRDTLQSNVAYYWQVRTMDAAENLSDYSELWSFKIKR